MYTPYETVKDRFIRRELTKVALYFETVDGWCAEYVLYAVDHRIRGVHEALASARAAVEKSQGSKTICLGELGEYCEKLRLPFLFGIQRDRYSVIHKGDEAMQYIQDKTELEYWRAASDHWLKWAKRHGSTTQVITTSVVEHALYGIFTKLESCMRRLQNRDVPKLIRCGIEERMALIQDIIDTSIRYDEEIDQKQLSTLDTGNRFSAKGDTSNGKPSSSVGTHLQG